MKHDPACLDLQFRRQVGTDLVVLTYADNLPIPLPLDRTSYDRHLLTDVHNLRRQRKSALIAHPLPSASVVARQQKTEEEAKEVGKTEPPTSPSTNNISPGGAGLTYVQLSTLDTPGVTQKSGRVSGAMANEVTMSWIVACAPPCSVPAEFDHVGGLENSKTTQAWLGLVLSAEIRLS